VSEIHPGTPPAPAAVEVPPDGARIARTGCDGGVLVIAFAPSVPPDRIAEVSHNAHHASGLKVIAVADVAAVCAWHPHDAAAILAAAREQLAIATGALSHIKDGHDAGTHAHDVAHSALDEIDGVKPAALGEAAQLREQLAATLERLENLAGGLELSATATAPSRKSDIERGCAGAVREIAASITVPEGGDDA
jgi:hypothetical protein